MKLIIILVIAVLFTGLVVAEETLKKDFVSDNNINSSNLTNNPAFRESIIESISIMNSSINESLNNFTNITVYEEVNTTNLTISFNQTNNTEEYNQSFNDSNNTISYNQTNTTIPSNEINETNTTIPTTINQTNTTFPFNETNTTIPTVQNLTNTTVNNETLNITKTKTGFKKELRISSGNKLLAIYDEEVQYVHENFLGSMVLSTNNNSEVIANNSYDPFGFTTSTNGVSYTGHETSHPGKINAGLRDYNTKLMRWQSPDPKLHDTQSPYVYVDNNPFKYTDPDGALEFANIKQYKEIAINYLNEVSNPIKQLFGVGMENADEAMAPVTESEMAITTIATTQYTAELVEDVSVTVFANAAESFEGNPVQLRAGAEVTLSGADLFNGEGFDAISSKLSASASVANSDGQTAGGGIKIDNERKISGAGAIVSTDVFAFAANPDYTSMSVSIPVGTAFGGVTKATGGFTKVEGSSTLTAGVKNSWGVGNSKVEVGCKVNCKVRDFNTEDLKKRIDSLRSRIRDE